MIYLCVSFMGNVQSSKKQPHKKVSRKWDWEYKNGRMVPKARRATTSSPQPSRPLFRRQRSNNYNWWIGNPNVNLRRQSSDLGTYLAKAFGRK